VSPDIRGHVIAVVGAADAPADGLHAAESVGRLREEQGAVVVCGGGGGVMEAAYRGALAQSGISVGLLPGSETAVSNAFLTIRPGSHGQEARRRTRPLQMLDPRRLPAAIQAAASPEQAVTLALAPHTPGLDGGT